MENDTERLTPQEEEAEQVRQRSKEGLIEKQRWLRDPGRVDLIQKRRFAHAFLEGNEDLGRTLVAQLTSFTWKEVFIRNFDLKLINEQGAMLADGSVPMRACGPAAVFRWTAGEAFADVAARGAAMVRDAVKEHLAPKFVMVHKERDRFAVYNDREARKSEIKVSSTNHVTCDHAFRSDADARAATADLAEMALQFKRLKQAAHPGFSMGGTFAPDAAATDYYFGASSIVARECAACGTRFTTCPEYDPKWIDTYGKSATICSACYPKMSPAHAIIGERIVKARPMPDEIRRGMVFWSSAWFGGTVVVQHHSGNGWWYEIGGITAVVPTSGFFLGCDPNHAAPEDCERYGVAPGFETR